MVNAQHREQNLLTCAHCQRTVNSDERYEEIELFGYSRYGVGVKHLGVLCSPCLSKEHPRLAKA